ncbi:hypothetical protein GCM10028808_63030 [Spirosoma migulaei]
MAEFNSDKNKLIYKHLLERRTVLTAEIQAWRQLRIRHKQAIQRSGLLGFTAWNEQKEEIQELSLKFTLLRAELDNRQQKELDE